MPFSGAGDLRRQGRGAQRVVKVAELTIEEVAVSRRTRKAIDQVRIPRAGDVGDGRLTLPLPLWWRSHAVFGERQCQAL